MTSELLSNLEAAELAVLAHVGLSKENNIYPIQDYTSDTWSVTDERYVERTCGNTVYESKTVSIHRGSEFVVMCLWSTAHSLVWGVFDNGKEIF